MTTAKREATVEDLYNAPDDGYKYELVHGELKRMPPTGDEPNYSSGRIYRALDDYAIAHGGRARTEGAGYIVNLLHRRSLSPDASYGRTPPRRSMRFVNDPPIFAAEVRSEHDYGATANREYAEKRDDYFAVGTEVVWDVDPIKRTVTKHVRGQDTSVTWGEGEEADAEPALPGWRVAVESLFTR